MREINLALALAGIGAERRPPFEAGGAAGEGGGAKGRERRSRRQGVEDLL